MPDVPELDQRAGRPAIGAGAQWIRGPGRGARPWFRFTTRGLGPHGVAVAPARGRRAKSNSGPWEGKAGLLSRLESPERPPASATSSGATGQAGPARRPEAVAAACLVGPAFNFALLA